MVLAVCILLDSTIVSRAALGQPESTTSAAQPTTTVFLNNLTRAESWNYFEPKPAAGDPRYTFIANRLRFGVRHTAERYELLGAGQYVQMGGLPTDAAGPGPYGTGGLYFGHSGNTKSRQVYLRYLSLRLKDLLPGLRAEVGRMGFSAGMESPSGDDRIERLKDLRVSARLIGEFEWSLYQRGYDGVRLDYTRPSWQVSATAFHPTQGGFEEAAGVHIDDVDVLTGSVTLRPGSILPRTDTQVFYYRYNDRRDVAARVDNSGLPPADRVDIQIDTYGITLAGAYPTGSGHVDMLLWVVGQSGGWYGQPHHASAVAAEAGYQWDELPWQPWLRLGVFRSSGDRDPTDDRHETFFQLLPTVRKYSLTASYNLMNSTDLFLQALVQPHSRVGARIDVHHVTLTEATDRWYLGAGATQKRGTIFGYLGRPSNGATTLGTVTEGSVSYRATRSWSFNGYVGVIKGGSVVLGSFDGPTMTYGYVEHVLGF